MGGLASFLHPVDPITRKFDPVAKQATEAVANSGLDPIAKKAWGKEDQSQRPQSTNDGSSLLEEKDAKKQLLGS
jgi:hypothetical protein